MTLLEKYQRTLEQQRLIEDSAQIHVIATLQALMDRLARPTMVLRLRQRYPGLVDVCQLSRLLRLDCLGQVETGVYIWGGVGRGKTFLMHLFFDSLPFSEKKRLHFHAFMQTVHLELGQMKKQKNPLKRVARNIARHTRVLCLDEFIVTNITDAMLISGLLRALFDYGVTLVATSNRIPDELYLNGLQRERFLPAIALLKQHCQVRQLDNGIDHRLALLEHSHLYNTPLNEENARQLEQSFHQLCAGQNKKNSSLTLYKRKIKTLAMADGIIWFAFNDICSAPRAAPDYIEIARQFHTVFISDVVQMDSSLEDKARRFIYLIDALYDSGVKLFISAERPPEDLYCGQMLEFAFQRSSSRLIEMRSQAYLARPHQLLSNPLLPQRSGPDQAPAETTASDSATSGTGRPSSSTPPLA